MCDVSKDSSMLKKWWSPSLTRRWIPGMREKNLQWLLVYRENVKIKWNNCGEITKRYYWPRNCTYYHLWKIYVKKVLFKSPITLVLTARFTHENVVQTLRSIHMIFFSMFILLRRPNNDSAFLQPSYLMVPSINLNATSCVFYFSFSFFVAYIPMYWRVTLTQTVFYAFTLANAAYDKHKNKIFSVSLRTVGSCHISFSLLASQRIIAWCFLFHPMCLCSQKRAKKKPTQIEYSREWNFIPI